MTVIRAARVALVLGTLAGTSVVARLLVPDGEHDVPPLPVYVQAGAPAVPVPRVSTDSLASVVARRDPFRADRRVPQIAFEPARAEGAAPTQAPRPRPALLVVGVLLGRSPAALVEGIPGTDGARLVDVGARVGDYVLRSVTRDSVVLQARDTMWTLAVRRGT